MMTVGSAIERHAIRTAYEEPETANLLMDSVAMDIVKGLWIQRFNRKTHPARVVRRH